MIEQRFYRGYILDMISAARKRGFAYTGFLSGEECAEADLLLRNEKDLSFSLYGGYTDADRRVLCIYTDAPPAWPISLMKVTVHGKNVSLSHRDVLGSIMALAVERRVIGDIICAGNNASVFILRNMGAFFSQNLVRIGGYTCDTCICDEWEEPQYERDFLDIDCVITSNRIDCYVAQLANISRSGSLGLIKNGAVLLNGRTVVSADTKLRAGDKLTIRGKGKFILETDPDTCSVTQKGRLRMRIKKYN